MSYLNHIQLNKEPNIDLLLHGIGVKKEPKRIFMVVGDGLRIYKNEKLNDFEFIEFPMEVKPSIWHKCDTYFDKKTNVLLLAFYSSDTTAKSKIIAFSMKTKTILWTKDKEVNPRYIGISYKYGKFLDNATDYDLLTGVERTYSAILKNYFLVSHAYKAFIPLMSSNDLEYMSLNDRSLVKNKKYDESKVKGIAPIAVSFLNNDICMDNLDSQYRYFDVYNGTTLELKNRCLLSLGTYQRTNFFNVFFSRINENVLYIAHVENVYNSKSNQLKIYKLNLINDGSKIDKIDVASIQLNYEIFNYCMINCSFVSKEKVLITVGASQGSRQIAFATIFNTKNESFENTQRFDKTLGLYGSCAEYNEYINAKIEK